MPTAKEIKLQRARQQKQQNTKHEQDTLIQNLTIKFNLLPPSSANYNELSEWIKIQHAYLSSIKADREIAIINNNKRIEKIAEEIRVEVIQATDKINDNRRDIEDKYNKKLEAEKVIYDEECKRIDDKHKYLIESNNIVYDEAREHVSNIALQIEDNRKDLREVNCKICSYKSKNIEIRNKVLMCTRQRKKAKQDRTELLKKLDTQRNIITEKINELQKKVNSYPDYRRNINADYYIWLDDIEKTKIKTAEVLPNTSNDGLDSLDKLDSSILIELHEKLNDLQNNDKRQFSDERYKELDRDRCKWLEEITRYNRQLDRLNYEFNKVNELCVEAYLNSINQIYNNNSGIHTQDNDMLNSKSIEETELNKEYKHLKCLKNTLSKTIKTLEIEKAIYEESVKEARDILDEETDGLGDKLNIQWERCNTRWTKVQNRIKDMLSEELQVLDDIKNKLIEKHNILRNEKASIEQDNNKLLDGDNKCKLCNKQIMLAIECLDKLQKLIG